MALKTKKAVRSRFKITKNKKILKKRIHQGHFNSKDTGDEGRRKRRSSEVSKRDKKIIKKYLPYS
tara:strand:+ start:251 stop:445 length:195 start_codon:yes stop_codon:yes gene_type:complete